MHAALLVLADGRFPGGGHAYSAGAEAAVRHGDIVDAATMRRFVEGRLATTGLVDAACAAAACRAVRCSTDAAARLTSLDGALDVRMPSPRGREVSRRLGRQLARSGARAAPGAAWAALGPDPHQAVATGVLAGVLGADDRDAALVTLHHLVAAVTTATVRLLGLDPVDAAACQLAVAPLVNAKATTAAAFADADVDALPAASGALAEILAEDHGTWEARLFVG